MFRNIVLIIAVVMIGVNLLAAIPPETVLAEYEGGKIRMADFNQRLDKIPPMYQTRYQTYEGKLKFLNDLLTEEVFYQEAIALGLDKSPEIEEKFENQIKSTYFTEYKADLLEKEMNFTDEELHEHFLNNVDDYPGITFEEAKIMVENSYRQLKSAEFIENYEKKLMEEYEVEIHEELLDSLDFNDMSTIDPIADQKYVTSNLADLEQTIGDLKKLYDGLPNQNKRPFLRKDSRINSVHELVKMDMYYIKAKAAGYDNDPAVIEIAPAIRRNLILRSSFQTQVSDKIDVSEEKVRKYYDENIEKFSTKAYRKIQAFAFDNEKTAKKQRKKVKKAVKKDDEEALNKLLSESLFEFDKGEINYIYKNGLIPKCGKDSLWNEIVWETAPGKTDPKKISDVFKSMKGEYVFFRILEDNIAVPTAFDEAKIKIENEMIKDKTRELFQETEAELRDKYAVKIFSDNLIDKLTTEEYFEKAENAQKKRRYNDAIYYYDQIIKFYAESSDAYKALFMKGFIYSEEMNDTQQAIEIFQQVISDYPEGELHESAEFMIKELKGESNILEKMEN